MGERTTNTTSAAAILIVEADRWERQRLVEHCRGHCDVRSRPETLQDLPDADLPADAAVLSVFVHSRVDAGQLDRLPALKFIATRSTGFDHIDLAACRRRGITVSNVPHYGENTVAEHTFALLLALTRKVHRCYERTVRGDFSIEGLQGTDLHGKTFGCLGVGNIGRHVLRIAGGFGMERIAHDVAPRADLAAQIGFAYVDFDTLLARSDVLSIHVPHNERTHHLIGAAALAKLPPGAIVLNTARGGIIDPEALIEALRGGRLGGAGLDVLEAENAIAEEAEILSSAYDLQTLRSIVGNHALLAMPNVIITPHVAFNSEQAVRRIVDTTLENVHAFLAGRPQNVVAAP